jgi:undecaprenyl pyrophosphate synthase
MTILTRAFEKAPLLVGWLLAAVSTITLYSVEMANVKRTSQELERRMSLVEGDIVKLRDQVSDMRLDVRESATILREWSRTR